MRKNTLVLTFAAFFLGACASFFGDGGRESTISSSLVDYLYPKESARVEHQPEIPTLALPLKIGIGFVPSSNWRGADNIAAEGQLALLEQVRAAFIGRDYIDTIEIIPSAYLSGGDGFSVMGRLSRLYDLDVMALVSYDQVSQTFENKASVLYWTIVGMYVIPGNENSVQTFVDTAVFDIPSKKMLMRAPGVSKVDSRTTAVDVNAAMATQSTKGFGIAVEDMIGNLNVELERFEERVKTEKVARVEHREGYSGGGSTSFFGLISLLLLMQFRRVRAFDNL